TGNLIFVGLLEIVLAAKIRGELSREELESLAKPFGEEEITQVIENLDGHIEDLDLSGSSPSLKEEGAIHTTKSTGNFIMKKGFGKEAVLAPFDGDGEAWGQFLYGPYISVYFFSCASFSLYMFKHKSETGILKQII
ncbi:hypothetical protein ACJX0J_012984, partial [Zea mays]